MIPLKYCMMLPEKKQPSRETHGPVLIDIGKGQHQKSRKILWTLARCAWDRCWVTPTIPGRRKHVEIRSWLATPRACYRGPKPQKCPKWLGEGAKGVFAPRAPRSPKSLLHHLNPVLHRCNSLLHQCKRTLAPWVQKTFCTPLLTTLGTFEVSGPCRHLGSQVLASGTSCHFLSIFIWFLCHPLKLRAGEKTHKTSSFGASM